MSPLVIENPVSNLHHQNLSRLTLGNPLQAYTPPPSIPNGQQPSAGPDRPPDSLNFDPPTSATSLNHPSSSSTSQGGEGVPSCANCGTASTPLWRRDGDGNSICNACGEYTSSSSLFLAGLHRGHLLHAPLLHIATGCRTRVSREARHTSPFCDTAPFMSHSTHSHMFSRN
jgi:hypothetical protein